MASSILANRKYDEIISTLPVENDWVFKNLVKYQNTWYNPNVLKGVMLAQDHFLALPSDIFLATFPKCGTTWLKALTFAIMNRKHFDFDQHPLLTKNPQECFPFLEVYFFQDQDDQKSSNPYSTDYSPRVFSIHTPYSHLPMSVCFSGSRIVYVTRDPKDVFVSSWHHMQKVRSKELPKLTLEEAFDMFCKGIYQFGSYWDHVLDYYYASIKFPETVLILTYEDLKKNPYDSLKKLASHLGHPFSLEEEKNGTLEKTMKLCSFENLSNLEVNKTGVQRFSSFLSIENHVFFRKGGIGDWQTLLTEEMEERMNQITKQKFEGITALNLMYA